VEKSRWKVRQQAHQRYTRATPPSTLHLTTMHSVRRPGGGYVNKPTSRAMTSVYVQTDVVQPVQTAGRGTPVPEMLCGTADVVDPELTQPGFTPPEESGPLSVLPRVCRAEVRCGKAASPHRKHSPTLNHGRVELPSERELPRTRSNVSTGPQLSVLISGRISVPDRPAGRGIDVRVGTKLMMKSAVSRSWSRVRCNATVGWRWRSSERGFRIDYIR